MNGCVYQPKVISTRQAIVVVEYIQLYCLIEAFHEILNKACIIHEAIAWSPDVTAINVLSAYKL